MDPTVRLVRTWMGSGRDIEIQDTVSGIVNGQITLLNVVKALGEYLTAEEDELRTKGVEFFSLVLGKCPPEMISRVSARVLVTFYCGKLDDTETIVPALNGLATLASLSTCTPSDVEDIIRALFFHVKMHALAAPNRLLVFSIIDSLMARQREALKSMHHEFLSGYVTLVEGEKDPRNLMTAFAIARVILIEFDIIDHIEALFNITFCYFPISFRPPADDPYGISPNDLKMALRSCLCATPLFGPLAIPLYLEKLMAGSPVSKRDTLQSMSASFPVYGASLARDSARKLWSSLKLEIFQPTDPITEEEALKTTQVLIRTIYADYAAHDMDTEDIQGLAREACEECTQILQEPEKSQAKPAIKVLCAFISTTPSVSRYTISQAIPHMVKLFLNPDELSNRAPITVLLTDLVAAARDSMSKSFTDAELEVPLMPFKDEVLGVFTVGLKATSSRQPALAGLKAMVNTPNLLVDNELGFIVHNADDMLQADPDDGDDAIDDTLDLLSSISIINPRHVEAQTLPLLFSSLSDKAPARIATADRAKYWRTLSALSKLCIQQELFETLVIRLSTKLDLICIPVMPTAHNWDLEPSAAYAHAILTALANTLRTKVDLGHTDVPKYIDRLVSRLYNLFIYSALLSTEYRTAATDPRVIDVAAQIITLVVRALPIQRQEVFAAALFSAYLSGDVKGIAEGHQKMPADKPFQPFQSASPESQRNLVALFAAGIVPLRKEVHMSTETPAQFLTALLAWNIPAYHSLQIQGIWHILASVVNKRADDISSFLSDMQETFWGKEIADTSISSERRAHAIKTWVWISKGLLVRSHPDAMRFVDRLFEVLDDEQIGWDAARGIGEIGSTDKILTKRNHAIIRILYAQKFFNSMLPRIMQGGQSSQSHEQSAYRVALVSLIKSMPQTAYMHEMPSLMPLLIRGLDLPDAEIRASVIDTFISAVGNDSAEHSGIYEYASTLVSTMLKNSIASEMSSTRVRIAALRYLGILPNIVRYDVLHPYKPTVIRELAKVLDDPKRSVRKEAVDARTSWFKYNG